MAVGLLAFAMGLVGLYLKRRLPERHISMGSRDMIGAIMGFLSLLVALVLRILVGSAHQFFSSQRAELESLGTRSLELELAFANTPQARSIKECQNNRLDKMTA